MTKQGTCKLCGLDKELQDSHFVGKAVYKRSREDSTKNPNPVVFTSTGVRQSSIQLRDYVFCHDCEQIFNKGGEQWMHQNIATNNGLPFLDKLRAHKPVINEPDVVLYDAATIPLIDCPAILHYGAGIFFKAACHEWKFEDGTTSQIDMSSERMELLRKFVHKGSSLPEEIVITVCVSTRPTQLVGFVGPIQMQLHGEEEARYYFHVSGVYFCILLGLPAASQMRALAFNNAGPLRPILVGEEWGEQAFDVMRTLSKGVTVSPKLSEGLKRKP
jgi:hypothetical protein